MFGSFPVTSGKEGKSLDKTKLCNYKIMKDCQICSEIQTKLRWQVN